VVYIEEYLANGDAMGLEKVLRSTGGLLFVRTLIEKGNRVSRE